ncbi:MAG: hypothetical protein KAS32_11285 [Candidatus Peribacteraceae bacterium]|nr:hypothetical protein [Candidatus Peribacteraceae bacterium]
MKKSFFPIALFVLLLTFGTIKTQAADKDAVFQSCLKQHNLTSSQFYSPQTSVEGNPVEFFEKYIGVMDCFVGAYGREDNGPGYMMIPYATNIKSFASSIGFSFVNYRSPMNAECQKKDVACTQAHWDDGYDCSANVWYPCLTESEIATEQAMVAAIRKYSLSLPMPHEESEEPICGPFEYFVGGRCQGIFELCGRDSLFTFNESTGNCSCPDLYIAIDGKCVHEDDLPPPPPRDDYYTPPTDPPVDEYVPLPPIVDTPPPLPPELPADDESWNAFCQPLDAELLSYNQYGIPIANAQIYSNYSVVTHIEGEVLIKVKGAPMWAPVFKGQRLTIGDKIKTSRNGRAEVKFANSAIFRMRPLSQLEIPDHKNSCDCHANVRVGYLDMKFGKVWSKVKPIGAGCEWSVKTPTAIAGGTDRWDSDLPRGYVSYPERDNTSTLDKLKNVWFDIINNLSSDDTPSNSLEHYRQPKSYHKNDMSEVVFNVIDIKKALAEDGSITLHVMHDDMTNTSSFYVEDGIVKVSDIDETASVTLSAGETMNVSPDTVPHDMDIEPTSQIVGQWWEEWDDESSGISDFIVLSILIIGITVTTYIIRKRKKKGFLKKTGIAILGFIITVFIIGLLA